MTGNMEHFWVDVKTALPEHCTHCWITYLAFGETENARTMYAFFVEDLDGKPRFTNQFGGYFNMNNVIAWMPMPKPYVPEPDIHQTFAKGAFPVSLYPGLRVSDYADKEEET